MAHIIVTDEWLSEKMPLVDAAIIEELENQTDDEYQFSQQFEIKMKKMFIKKNRADNHCYFRTAVAAVCTLIFLAISEISLALSSSTITLARARTDSGRPASLAT